MSNTEMTANRFAKFAAARRKVAWIKEMLSKGHTVAITNHMRSTRYSSKHADLFFASKNGAFVKNGKTSICIDFNKISAF